MHEFRINKGREIKQVVVDLVQFPVLDGVHGVYEVPCVYEVPGVDGVGGEVGEGGEGGEGGMPGVVPGVD